MPKHDAKEKCRQWLLDAGFTVEERQHPQAQWLYLVRLPNWASINIGRPIAHPHWLQLDTDIGIGPPLSSRIDLLEPEKRNTLLWNLRFALLQRDVEFQGLVLPLQRISLGTRLFVEELSRPALLRGVHGLFGALRAVEWTIAREMGEQPEAEGWTVH